MRFFEAGAALLLSCLSTLHIAGAQSIGSYPVCDVSIDSAVCLHNGEQVLLPDAKQYGLVLHIDFDSTRPLDSSGEKNHAAGKVMSASGFAGIGSSGLFRQNYVLVPHSDSFSASDFSYTFYVYLLRDNVSKAHNEIRDEYCPIVHKGIMREGAEEAAPAILFNPKNGRLKVVVSTDFAGATAGEEMESNSKLQYRQWYHIAVIRHINGIRLFVDGILDSTLATGGVTRTNDMPIYIGGAPYSENACDTPLLIDELRVYNRAIGRDQVQAEATGALGGIEPSFIHIGCYSCSLEEIENRCPIGYHLCNKLELYLGGYHVARKLSLGTDILAAGSQMTERGLGLCCADSG